MLTFTGKNGLDPRFAPVGRFDGLLIPTKLSPYAQ